MGTAVPHEEMATEAPGYAMRAPRDAPVRGPKRARFDRPAAAAGPEPRRQAFSNTKLKFQNAGSEAELPVRVVQDYEGIFGALASALTTVSADRRDPPGAGTFELNWDQFRELSHAQRV